MKRGLRSIVVTMAAGSLLSGCSSLTTAQPSQSPTYVEPSITTPSETPSASRTATPTPSTSNSRSATPSPSVSTYTPQATSSATESASEPPTGTAIPTESSTQGAEETSQATGSPNLSAKPSPADVPPLQTEQESSLLSELQKIDPALSGKRSADRAVNVCEDLLENEKSRAEIVERTKERFSRDDPQMDEQTAERIVALVQSSDFCVGGQ